ncbi:FecR family protein [Chitinophaga sp. 22321]|uniref:DUF4974 domain-containing protein n=1 Tax=Chitinophaga hostae TaxID=2831022 RepID=A0ABS5J6L2_9BACT|nr:FecR family protein [Chitinophaga hostae]MBS0030856.1 DUF4974 domain-containing protein [Chitinophaga hostae]
MDEKKISEALYIASLIKKQVNKEITAEELASLRAWIADSSGNEKIYREIASGEPLRTDLLKLEHYDTNKLTQNIFRKAGLSLSLADQVPGEDHVSRSKNKHLYWTWAAAAAAVFFAVALCFKAMESRTTPEKRLALNDIKQKSLAPGSNKAILTLADGSQVTLDNNSHDTLARQGNSTAIQHKGGLLAYSSPINLLPATVAYNTIVTPAGGRYEVVLSDGTHVFLNSASSLKYPASFPDSQREVILTGEAYFEVAHLLSKNGHGKRPFTVKIVLPSGDGGEVNVLGTHFNVMAYANESAVKTTLVSGSVDVHKGNSHVLIRPGQQAILSNNLNKPEVREADLEQELAWKSGKFVFKSTDIRQIMRQIARWYNVDIIYQGDMSGIRFSGDIMQKENAAQLFEILEADGRLHFSVTGNRVTVSRVSK